MECQNQSPTELYGDTIAERSISLLETGLYSDITLEAEARETSEVKIIHAHRCILARTSNVWGLAIKWSNRDTIRITEFPYEVVKSLIWFAYTGKLDVKSIEECCEVISAADFYNMAELHKLCSDFVCQEFMLYNKSSAEIVEILNHAVMYNVNDVTIICLAYVQNNPYQIFQSEHFLQLSSDSIKSMLSENIYLCSEFELTKTILSWARNACIFSQGTMKAFLENYGIDKLLRFDELTSDQINDISLEFPEAISQMISSSRESCQKDYDVSGIAILRGGLNEDLPSEVIVRSPPMTIREEFKYLGPSTVMPISSVEIEPRTNLLFPNFAGSYEESLSLQIGDFIADFDGVLPGRTGAILNISDRCTVTVENNCTFIINITLKRAGIYRKNTNFLVYREGLMRIKRGLIVDVNNLEKNLPFTVASTSHA